MQSKKINELGTNVSPSVNDLTVIGDAATGQLKKITLSQISGLFGSSGTVSSVAMTVPTGLTVTGSPITTSGTLAVTLTAGYSIPTTAKQTDWDTAFTDRFKWDGGATGIVAATGRTSLGATTVGSNIFTLTNPSAISFLRLNADNTISALDAATFRTAIGAGTSSTTGTVTSVAELTLGTTGTDVSSTVANGTTTPVITLNIPTASATNRGLLSSANWTTFNNKENAIGAGTTAQYWRGDKSWQTLNTTAVAEGGNLYYTDARVRDAISITTTGSSGSSTYSSSTGVINVPAYTLSGLGGQPLATNLTSLAGLSYVSTSFVKMTDAGTFSLDTNTYYLASNPSGYISGITSGMVTTALGYTPYNSSNPSGYISGINSSMVTTALGYTPVNKAGDTMTGLLVAPNSFNTQSSSYTLVLGDASKIIEMNVGSANTVTVPANASVAFPNGTEITVMQYGAGNTTIVAASGVTIRSKDFSTRIGDQYTGATLIKRSTNEWYLIGNIQP